MYIRATKTHTTSSNPGFSYPGFFPAEQNRKILQPERFRKIMELTPMARFGEPHELVGATLLLLFRQVGSFMTGAEIYFEGGFTGMRF